MPISGIESRTYVFPFEPPLRVAWDPIPRTHQEATIVIVSTHEGLEGRVCGDRLPGVGVTGEGAEAGGSEHPVPDRVLRERLLIGVDPLRTEVVREVFETVDFHHG